MSAPAHVHLPDKAERIQAMPLRLFTINRRSYLTVGEQQSEGHLLA